MERLHIVQWQERFAHIVFDGRPPADWEKDRSIEPPAEESARAGKAGKKSKVVARATDGKAGE